MTESQCRHREAFVLATLEGDRCEAFERRLAECDSCDAYVRAERQLDDLLRGAADAEPVPQGLAARIESMLVEETPAAPEVVVVRRRRVGFMVAAAAVLTMAIGGILIFNAVVGPSVHGPNLTAHGPGENTTPTLSQVVFEAGAPVLAHRVETTNPDITIVWIYPAPPAGDPTPETLEKGSL